MQLSKEAMNYISTLALPNSIHSNLLITDLEKIIYTATAHSDELYISKPLSENILLLINEWKVLPIAEDLFFMENHPSLTIINNDTATYSAQMIFPLYLNDNLEGLVIYYRNYGNYIKSSYKAPNTIRKWIMKYMENEIFPIYKTMIGGN